MLKNMRYCDRCGHIIEETEEHFTIGYTNKYDLCKSCSNEVKRNITRFLNNKV